MNFKKFLACFFSVFFPAAIFSAPILQAASALPAVQLKVAFPNLKFDRPLWLCESPDGTKRLFVAQQAGKILILPNDRDGAAPKTFLDISDRKPFEKNEEGLLGLAFHPQCQTNGKFYIYYSQQNPRRSVISEFQISKTNSDQADKSSERILLEIPQPDWNHNGGELIFGPDSLLYIALGDGGGKNDQYHNGQNLSSLLGKILRIDVNSRSGNLAYGIPKDNPFIGQENVRAEIWAYGLRNPWRFSFDRKSGELYCADVGQDKWEEIDLITKGGNYGWSFREGFHEFGTNAPPADAKFIDPILEYPHFAPQTTNHSPGLSITGGYVYRGKKLPELDGLYLYADFLMGTLWGLRCENGKVTIQGALVEMPRGLNPPRQISSFGEDADGEIYILSYDGKIYELEKR
ncbi:MAG: PQQ-dependent sugar dehydrogenase [Verrucomicrobiota bacterium]|nr:PQQ-dependent sugar dehydrogenase [Verrucomicrobiota bacterium]